MVKTTNHGGDNVSGDQTTTNDGSTTSSTMMKTIPALVFGASGEQGRAVVEGLVDLIGVGPIYGFTSDNETLTKDVYLSDALQCVLLEGTLGNPKDVEKALLSTKAEWIFVTTCTEMPVHVGDGFVGAQEEEYDCIVGFFKTLVKVHAQDGLKRTVILSTRDNVQELCLQHLEQTGQVWIPPLDDGSIVPHYSAKGKGAKAALELVKDIEGLELILLTMPFFYSNFLAFFVPLPIHNEQRTQWELTASLGDGSTTKIDMMNVSDLGPLVANLFQHSKQYKGQNLRIASERISMNEIAQEFSDLFGKDVIYNPLLQEELANLEFPSAPAMAQMCHYLATLQQYRPNLQHDLDLTAKLLKPKSPTTFTTWLLTHSDSTAFSRVGLDRDAPELSKICVFGALSPQGISVVKGLLADTRKSYKIRCTTRKDLSTSAQVQEMISWDPERVEFVHADFDNVESCQRAVEGMDGAFLVADLNESTLTATTSTNSNNNNNMEDEDDDDEKVLDMETEERRVRNIIDACEGRVKHLVFSTMESCEVVNKELPEKELLEFSPKARAAAYARSKQLSVTFVLMPCYSEVFFDMMEVRKDDNGNDKIVFQQQQQSMPAKPTNDGKNDMDRSDAEAAAAPPASSQKFMCMSLEELGPAVANIFDSYECFAGHEIGLVTDFVTVSEVQEIFQDVFASSSTTQNGTNTTAATTAVHTILEETEESVETTKDWVEARDTYMKDLGQLFANISHSDAIMKRHSIAQTYQLIPSARNLRRWVEQNKDNPAFREKLGLR